MRAQLFSAAALLLIATGEASAQHALDKYVTEDKARVALDLALRNIHKARCGGSACAAATASELARPPVSVTQAQAIMKTGTMSGMAEWCGLNWRQRSFLPMMIHHKAKLRLDERRLALVGIIHGYQQGFFAATLKSTGPCSNDTRAMLSRQLPGAELERD